MKENYVFDKLNEFLEMRQSPETDTNTVDEKIWEMFGQTQAVMFTDLAGFTKISHEKGILEFLTIIYNFKSIFNPILDKYNGKIIKIEGDSYVVLFENIEDSVKASLEALKEVRRYNDSDESFDINLCIGIGYGIILNIDYQDIYGDEVNQASKLGEDIADSDEILLTPQAYEKTRKMASFEKVVDKDKVWYKLKHDSFYREMK